MKHVWANKNPPAHACEQGEMREGNLLKLLQDHFMGIHLTFLHQQWGTHGQRHGESGCRGTRVSGVSYTHVTGYEGVTQSQSV